MATFDRYMLRLLLVAFGFFGLVLVLVYWINRAVLLFDRLIANGESMAVFVELSVLTLPAMVAIVLPVAAFAAAVFVSNRLASENELVVAQSAGFSPWRMARPVAVFGLLAAAFLMVLNHVLVPISQERLARRQAEISQNVTARFLSEGTFVHPSDGITLYIREITPEGELLDLFLSDRRNPAREVVYSAERSLIVRADGGPRLVMFRGLAQVLEAEGARLTVTSFEDLAIDLGDLAGSGVLERRQRQFLSTPQLLAAGPALRAEIRSTPGQIAYEVQQRSARAMLALVAALIGFGALIQGGFSRFGLWRQIFGAVVMLAGLKFLDNMAAGAAMRAGGRAWVIHLPWLAGLGLVAVLLWLAARPAGWWRRPAARRREAAS